jgi:hypothetical protein
MISSTSAPPARQRDGPHLFEVLQRAGLISRGKPDLRAIMSVPFSRMIDIADAISGSLNPPAAHRLASPYIHSVCLGLGGAPAECEHRRCRLSMISSLARFAGLYSDGVMIHNFFADYGSVAGHPPKRDSEEFRCRIADHITVALSVRPLIDAGLIRLFSPASLQDRHHLCMNCLAKHIFGEPGHRRFKESFDQLSNQCLASMSVEAFYENDPYHLRCRVPEELYEHGGIVYFGELPDNLTKLPRILSRINRGERVQLSKASRRTIGIHRRVASIPIKSIVYHAAVTNALSTSFLTHRKLDIELLHAISGDPVVQRRNDIIPEHFQLMLPFADGVPVSQLLKLRKREEEAFFRFQAAMHRTVAEVRSVRGDITAQDARNLYGDVIRPRLAELDQKIQEAKRDLIRYPAASLAGTVAVLGFGFFSGMLAAQLQAVIGALGAYKTVHELTAKTIELSDVKKAVRHDDMYFLWRARNLSKTKW